MTIVTGSIATDLEFALRYPWLEGSNDEIQFLCSWGFALDKDQLLSSVPAVRNAELSRLYEQARWYQRMSPHFRAAERAGTAVEGYERIQISPSAGVEFTDEMALECVAIVEDTRQYRPDRPKKAAPTIAGIATIHSRPGPHNRTRHIHKTRSRTLKDFKTASKRLDAVMNAVAGVRIDARFEWPATVSAMPRQVEAVVRTLFPDALPTLVIAMRARVAKGIKIGRIEPGQIGDAASSQELADIIHRRYRPNAAARRAERLVTLGTLIDGRRPDDVVKTLAEAGWTLAIGDRKTNRGTAVITLFPIQRIAEYGMAPLVLAYAAVVIAAPETMLWLLYGSHSDYLGLSTALRLLIIATLLGYAADVVAAFLHGVSAVHLAFQIAVIGAVATVVIAPPLIGTLGLIGVCLTHIGANLVRLVASWIVLSRLIGGAAAAPATGSA